MQLLLLLCTDYREMMRRSLRNAVRSVSPELEPAREKKVKKEKKRKRSREKAPDKENKVKAGEENPPDKVVKQAQALSADFVLLHCSLCFVLRSIVLYHNWECIQPSVN